MTTQLQIDAMRSVCEKLIANGSATSAHVDDWGKFGNFTLMVTPSVVDRFSTSKLKSAVRKLLPPEARLRDTFPPDVVWRYRPGLSRRRECRSTTWTLDVDFEVFHKELNRFESQL